MIARETIMALAEEVGINLQAHVGVGGRKNIMTFGSVAIEKMEAFYRAAHKAGMEEAAKVCDDLWQNDASAYDCREAIREKAAEVMK